MLLNILSALLGVGVIIAVVESLKRFDLVHGELARKAIHIFSGLFLAATPLWMERSEIVVVALIMLAFILFSRGLHLITAIEDVRRWTVGEELYGVSVAVAALIFDNGAVYAAAILHLALADGLAGLIGSNFGKKHSYHWFWASKTLVGSATFYVTSLLLWAGFLLTQDIGAINEPLFLLSAPAFMTMVEGSLGAGFDNFGVPLIAGYIAQHIII